MVRNVFLSFVEEDLGLVNLFRGQVFRENSDLKFHDYSVKDPYKSRKPEYIKSRIRQKLDLVSVTLCLIGTNTHNSEFVNWEIEASVRKGKGLVGVRLNKDQPDKIPPAFTKHGGYLCNWNHAEISKAIRHAAY